MKLVRQAGGIAGVAALIAIWAAIALGPAVAVIWICVHFIRKWW